MSKDEPQESQFEPKGVIFNGILSIPITQFNPPFELFRLGRSRIFIGSYPECEDDVITLAQHQVNGVLNFFTVVETQRLNLSQGFLQNLYSKNGVDFVKNLPIDDGLLDQENGLQQLFLAVEYLNDMLNNKDLTVFVHSCSGFCRASTVILLYLSIYENHHNESE